MTTTYTQHVITVDDYRRTPDPAELIKFVEDSARRTLTTEHETPAGEVLLGWMARVTGYDVHEIDGRKWVPWEPGAALPEHADQLACRARRHA